MNADRILSQLLSGGAGAGLAGGLAGGLASGLLVSKAGRRLGKRALELGGVAAVAGLAYGAYRRWRETSGAAAGSVPDLRGVGQSALSAASSQGSLGPQADPELGVLLLRAMVAAAHADGKLEPSERGVIFERIARLDIASADKAELWDQLDHPVGIDALAASAATPERAAAVYAAALLAIEVDSAQERAWLSQLAARLRLAPELVASLHSEAGVAPELREAPSAAPVEAA